MLFPCPFSPMRQPADIARAFDSPSVIALVIILVLFCTMTAYMMMNYWQPHVTATEAGLLYGIEPVFAGWLGLFLPGFFSAGAGFSFRNGGLPLSLFWGGWFILGAMAGLHLRRPGKE